MILCIKEWKGRLGNNIIQVRNALCVAVYSSYNLQLPPHRFFKKTFIQLVPTVFTEEYIDHEGNHFFASEKITKFPQECFQMNYQKVSNILLHLFTIDYKRLPVLEEDAVVIHIRSGDIFGKYPHPLYIVPPLSYYIHILKTNTFSTIYLLAEDTNNPCIGKLLALYPNIQFKKQSLLQDMELLLRAQTIVLSFGSFVPSLLHCTRYTKHIFVPSNSILQHLNVATTVIDISDYVQAIQMWKNTVEQRILLLEFPTSCA